MIRRFRELLWTLKRVDSMAVRTHIECVSGAKPCGAEPPATGAETTPEVAEAWAEFHFKTTGHRRFERVYCDTVQWDPPTDVDPRTIEGVST
ncbi:hypothetical protein [Streptomyces albipurpureus]|uniref:SnoaL-like domain-containing protein n=1 Tax=Streptomyces albipurpureus TaxID=2897419 RepID=A0ABT0UVF3_9ACTN|nr:hypothetical protein [Streptomyces sp. CWNU-1]MCM2392569.1 hypothetical protein [Streptomyces sp. CWNU-1]